MYTIAVMGDRDSVMGFAALGLSIYPCDGPADARKTLKTLASSGAAVIYITERLAAGLTAEIDAYKDELTPAVILIPGQDGSLGLGMGALQSAVERAVGADILNT